MPSSYPTSSLLLFSVLLFLPLGFGHSPSCGYDSLDSGSGHHHHDDDDDGGDHIHHHHHHGNDHDRQHPGEIRLRRLPEELAEDEDLELGGFDHDHRHHHHHDEHDVGLSPIGLWVNAMGCSLLVSLASLICLMILPVICLKGKPSKAVVDSLAVFGAGAMLGDAFLHQLPHAFGGKHSHSHEHHIDDINNHHHGHGQSHSHSLQDLSVGLSILSGIILFLLVEKVVRYVEEHTKGGAHSLGHRHHHCHKGQNKLKDDDESHDGPNLVLTDAKGEGTHVAVADSPCQKDDNEHEPLIRMRVTSSGSNIVNQKASCSLNGHANGVVIKNASSSETLSSCSPSSLIFGYLNLFSDGVHNFTDGMALGSAFLLHGSVGGWSRTLFLLAHEIPQEIGDFGILVRAGFSVSKALFFNFLSALVALAGTALALILGKDPGQSSLIEGFTAGGFIYIAVAGVLPEMNNEKTTVRSTAVQLTSLVLGMAVALCISLVE